MTYREQIKDLFTVPEHYYLAHCISADFAMGKGIAVEFNKQFNTKQHLIRKYKSHLKDWVQNNWTYNCILEDRVFNLITKQLYWHKPTYQTLAGALTLMKDICIEQDIHHIAMPVIGCGLDRLQWSSVSEIIKEIFRDTDIEIIICRQH